VIESTCESVCLAANIHVNVCVREWMCLIVRETTCDSVCLRANLYVNVGVREWMWLNVPGSACESVCEVFDCVRIHM
jgi:hypothetical protein